LKKKPRDTACVLGLEFADIIHSRPKVTIVGLTCKDFKEVMSDYWKLLIAIFDNPDVVRRPFST